MWLQESNIKNKNNRIYNFSTVNKCEEKTNKKLFERTHLTMSFKNKNRQCSIYADFAINSLNNANIQKY